MSSSFHTIHARPGRDEVVAIGDGAGTLAAIPPLWALVRELWGLVALEIALLAAVGWVAPAALGTVWLALVVLTALEGATLQRLEWRLYGWREVGWVDATSEAGAEEAWLEGRAMRE